LDRPEDAALAAARAIAERLANEMPEVQAGIGVAAGQIVAGNVGAKQRFSNTQWSASRSTRRPDCANWPNHTPRDC
ncbi:hypothetical protein N103_03837, partial [Mycobacterium tuberculosis MAL020156]